MTLFLRVLLLVSEMLLLYCKWVVESFLTRHLLPRRWFLFLFSRDFRS